MNIEVLAHRLALLSLAILVPLAGCSSVSVPAFDLARTTISGLWRGGPTVVIPERPDPAYRYLRVDVAGRPSALMASSFVEQGALGEVEVWYSSLGEVIRTASGRIVGTAGLETDWRAVRYSTPPISWSEAEGLPSGSVAKLARSRDVMPGYRFSVLERLELTKADQLPDGARPVRLPKTVTWYVERTVAPTRDALPESIYAVALQEGKAVVVYSRQCLSAALCLHLQPWPVPGTLP